MMGESDPQRSIFYNLSLESFVPAEHPLRRIRPLIDRVFEFEEAPAAFELMESGDFMGKIVIRH